MTQQKRKVPAWALRSLSPIGLVIIWQLASYWRIIPQSVLPPPQFIVQAGWDLAKNGQLFTAIRVSTERVVIGLFFGVLIGIGLGLVVGLSRTGEFIVDPLMQMLRALPSIGLIPLFIVWFGIGELPKIILIAISCLFPLYLNTFSAMRNMDQSLIDVAEVLNFSRFKKLRVLYLPSATEQILVGLRQAFALAWLALVVAEQVNADAGIGFIINNARDFLRIDVIIFALIVYAILGITTDSLVRVLEQHFLKYRRVRS